MDPLTINPTILADIRELAAIERPRWGTISAGITGPRCEGDTTPVTVEEWEARAQELTTEIVKLEKDAVGRRYTADERSRWNDLNKHLEDANATIQELTSRRERVQQLAEQGGETALERGATFHTPKPGKARGDEIYDLSTVARSYGDPEKAMGELRDRAMRSLERSSFAHPDVDQARAKAHVEQLIHTDEELTSLKASEVAERMLVTGSPEYKRAFAKICSGREASLTSAERQAAERAFTIASTGNYPVPYTLDPTLIKVSNGSVNPLRAVARVEQITGNTWKGVTAAGITASYVAEQTAATDNTPTLTQPELNVEKAHAFVPFSMETGQDWGTIQADLATLFSDAKDDLEATKFVVGAGHGSNEPQGIITGATTTTTAGGTAAFAVADVYKLFEALPARFRARGRFLGAINQYDRVRQFDTGGGASLWKYLDAGAGEMADGAVGTLLGKPAHEATAMATALTTGSKILAFGDFRHYLIVDRIGLDIEYIPHLFDTSTGFPTGTRGMYAYWRNTAEVLSANAFRVLVTG